MYMKFNWHLTWLQYLVTLITVDIDTTDQQFINHPVKLKKHFFSNVKAWTKKKKKQVSDTLLIFHKLRFCTTENDYCWITN